MFSLLRHLVLSFSRDIVPALLDHHAVVHAVLEFIPVNSSEKQINQKKKIHELRWGTQ